MRRSRHTASCRCRTSFRNASLTPAWPVAHPHDGRLACRTQQDAITEAVRRKIGRANESAVQVMMVQHKLCCSAWLHSPSDSCDTQVATQRPTLAEFENLQMLKAVANTPRSDSKPMQLRKQKVAIIMMMAAARKHK